MRGLYSYQTNFRPACVGCSAAHHRALVVASNLHDRLMWFRTARCSCGLSHDHPGDDISGARICQKEAPRGPEETTGGSLLRRACTNHPANHRAALDAGSPSHLYSWRYWPGASERGSLNREYYP